EVRLESAVGVLLMHAQSREVLGVVRRHAGSFTPRVLSLEQLQSTERLTALHASLIARELRRDERGLAHLGDELVNRHRSTAAVVAAEHAVRVDLREDEPRDADLERGQPL